MPYPKSCNILKVRPQWGVYSPLPLLIKRSTWGDVVAIGLTVFFIYAIVNMATEWRGLLQTEVHIDLSISALPLYSLYSFSRALGGLLVSLSLAIFLGYLAGRTRWGERIILPVMDIGQSIPVLGFMPGLVLSLIALFPDSNVGLELACVILFVTSQVWNLVFSFYSSLKSISPQLYEVSAIIGQSWWQRFIRIEIPSSATGLAWNSLVSMAGGWFFLTVCESFTLGNQNFKLPGLGSYMAAAIDQNDTRAIFAAIIAMILIIFISDFLLWRPIIAWTRKFRQDEAQRGQVQEIPFMTLLLRESRFVQRVLDFFTDRRWWKNKERIAPPKKKRRRTANLPAWGRIWNWFTPTQRRDLFDRFVQGLIAFSILFTLGWFIELVKPLTRSDVWLIGQATGLTFARVLTAIALSSLWTIPFGIWVGLSARLTRIFQPFIQMMASFPAPMLYPFLLGVTQWMGIPLGFSSIFLLMLGSQWYILFNVLAGAYNISAELRDQLKLIDVTRWKRWRLLYIPSVFPALITGWLTAAGGAWNASIVAEFIQFKGEPLKTLGLGALISESSATGNYTLLAGCLMSMVATVILLNRTLWKKLFHMAETKFRFD